MRQSQDALQVLVLFFERYDVLVRDEIVDERCAAGRGIAQPRGLNATGSLRHYAQPVTRRVTLEIDQQIEPIRSNAVYHDVVWLPRDIDEMLDSMHESRSHFAAVVGTVRVGEEFETLAIVE